MTAKTNNEIDAPETDRAAEETNTSLGRRTVLTGIAAASTACGCHALGLLPARSAHAEDGAEEGASEAANMPPQIGDKLAFAFGKKQGELIKPEDLPFGRDQKMAYPLIPESGAPRDGSRLNMVLLIRLDAAELDEETSANAAEGVVAYSAVCTHHGCPVTMWKKANETLFCSCHGTEYDPKAGATIIAGPAPRRLAMLPLAMEDGHLVVAGEFTSRVGSQN